MDRQTVMKASEQLICCNCTKRGHDATTCRQLRWSQHFSTPIFVSSYTAGPLYNWPLKEKPQADDLPTTSSNIVNVEDTNRDILPNDCDQNPESQTLLNSDRVKLYKFGNTEVESNEYFEIQRRLDTMENVCVGDLRRGIGLPVFLDVWKQSQFTARITHNLGDDSVLLSIRAESKELLDVVEKLTFQWLTRSEFERQYMPYKKNKHGCVSHMIHKLKTGYRTIVKSPAPSQALKNIHKVEKKCKSDIFGACQLPCQKQKLRKLRNIVEETKLRFGKNWYILNVSLHRHSWIPGGQETVNYYHSLANQMIQDEKLPVIRYMNLLYVYNNLLAFYYSDHLNETLRGSAWRLQPCKLIIDSLDALTVASNGVVESPNETIYTALQRSIASSLNSIVHRMNEQINELSCSDPNIVPNPRYSVPGPNNDNDTTMQNTLPNNYRETSSNDFQPVELPRGLANGGLQVVNHENLRQDVTNFAADQVPRTFNIFDQPAADFIGLNETNPSGSNSFGKGNNKQLTKNKKAKGKKQQNKSSAEPTLLMNMSGKLKQSYYKSIKAAIKLANSSNINRLQRFAKVLRFKIIDGTITIEDVHTLQASILKRLKPNPEFIGTSPAFATWKYAGEDFLNAKMNKRRE